MLVGAIRVAERAEAEVLARRAGGLWLLSKWRSWVAAHGVRQAAKNARKRGIPVELALQLLRAG